MSIVAEANVPNLLLEFRLLDRTITYRGMMKVFPDGFWDSEVRPKLYPMWDTEKDRLVEFTWYDNSTYHCVRRKFIKNFKTGEYEWKDYEMEETDVTAARSFYEFLKDTFINIEQIQNTEFQEEMGRMYGEVRTESWLSIRLARNFLLQETDYIFCSDVTMSDEVKARYQMYRQKLRDLPSQFADATPNEVKFPMSPEAFDAVYAVNNPEIEYLSTEDQWIALGSFFFAQFRDKMAKYLSVRDITDRMYNARFLEALRTNPVGMGGTAWSVEHQNLDTIKEQLDLLLNKLDEGGAA